MTLEHLQKIRKGLPGLLTRTKMYHYENDIAFTLDPAAKVYFKREVAFHLYTITRQILASQDVWSIIADILFTNHSITLFSIMTQISPVYTPAMLPFLTAYPLDKNIFNQISQTMDVNIILYKPQLCPDYVVRLEQFNIDIISTTHSKTTWVIYTEPVDCLHHVDHLNELYNVLEDPAIDIDPTVIAGEFTLTLADNKDIDNYSQHFMRITYNFYYNASRYRAQFDEFQGSRWNALLYVWGGTRATLPDHNKSMSVRLLIAQCVKISTSVNGLVSIIYKDNVCHITRFPNKHYIVCNIGEKGELSMPYYSYQDLELLNMKSVCEFVNEYGDILLSS